MDNKGEPHTILVDDVKQAAKLLELLPFYVQRTPCLEPMNDKQYNMHLYYKMENFQKCGSCKSRGILCALMRLPEDVRRKGLVIASLGNAAIGLCHYTNRNGIPVIVVVPITVPLSIRQQLVNLGAKVIMSGKTLYEAEEHGRAVANKSKLVYITSHDHPDVLTGYGTIALEILQDVPQVDAVIVPVGTGGLAAAISAVIKEEKKDCLVYGVQPELAKAFFIAMQDQNPDATFLPGNTLATHLNVAKARPNSYHNAIKHLDKILLVKEEWIAQAMLRLTEQERFIVEPAAACPLAAIIGQLVPELRNKTVVCILSGGNIEIYKLTRCLQRGTAEDGRFLKFTVDLTEQTLTQTELLKLLKKKKYNIIDHTLIRHWTSDDVYKLKMTLLCEAANLEHTLKLRRLMENTYPGGCEFENEPFVDKRTCECFVFSHIPYIAKPPILEFD